MKKSLAAMLLASLLAACSFQQAPNPNGYLGYIYGFYDGKIAVAGHIRDVGADKATCQREVDQAVQELEAQAPNGASVAGICYPVPAAPPPISGRPSASNSSPNGSQTL